MSNIDDDNETKRTNMKTVGGIRHTYGALYVTTDNGRYFWAIEDCMEGCTGFSGQWEQITPELYGALMVFEDCN